MANKKSKTVLPYVSPEDDLRQRMRELRQALGDYRPGRHPRSRQHQLELLVAHLGKFEALVTLWRGGG